MVSSFVDVEQSACLPVCVSLFVGYTMTCAKTAEPIVMSFWGRFVWAQCHVVLEGVQMSHVWLSDVTFRALDLQLNGHVFNFRPFHCRVTTLGKFFTHICLCYPAV